jgi:predicted lactoylglutathione lyase
MATKLFVNLPVTDLERSKAFFTELDFDFFGMAPGMAAVVINEDTQVMLLDQPTFAGYAQTPVDARAAGTEAILVLGLENVSQVDGVVDKALAAGATSTGDATSEGGRYTRGFVDLDGHRWAALCLV